MPISLAIETSGRVGSIALANGDRILAESLFPYGLKHAAGIVPIIQQLCQQQACLPSDLRQIFVSAGPGSFTGLRIGITVAKTLALATAAKTVAVPTALVLAENAPPDARHIIIVLDAKRDQIFTARFERADDHWTQRESAHLDSLSVVLDRAPRPVHLLGDGIPFHLKHLPPGDSSVILTPENTWRAKASAVAKLGMQMALAGNYTDPYRLVPIYIRPPEAEEKRLAALAANPPPPNHTLKTDHPR